MDSLCVKMDTRCRDTGFFFSFQIFVVRSKPLIHFLLSLPHPFIQSLCISIIFNNLFNSFVIYNLFGYLGDTLIAKRVEAPEPVSRLSKCAFGRPLLFGLSFLSLQLLDFLYLSFILNWKMIKVKMFWLIRISISRLIC